MKIIRWNEEKNIKLRLARGVSFEDIEEAILDDHLHSIEMHPDQEKYPNQKKLFVEIDDYIYVVLDLIYVFNFNSIWLTITNILIRKNS